MKIYNKIIYALYKEYRKKHDMQLSYFRLKTVLFMFTLIPIGALYILMFRLGINVPILKNNVSIIGISLFIMFMFIIGKVIPKMEEFEDIKLSKKELEEGDFYGLLLFILVVFLFIGAFFI